MGSVVAAPNQPTINDQAGSSSLQSTSQHAQTKRKRETTTTGKQPSAKKPRARAPPKPRETEEERVNRRLLMAGYQDPEKSNKCVRAGLARGKFSIKFTGEAAQLDAVVMQGKCSKKVPDGSGGTKRCKGILAATIRNLLDQPEMGGFKKGSPAGPPSIFCSLCQGGAYVTNCCYSGPRWLWADEFHFHCRKCPKMGLCWSDYHLMHCDECDRHFYTVDGTGECYHCGAIYTEKQNWPDMFREPSSPEGSYHPVMSPPVLSESSTSPSYYDSDEDVTLSSDESEDKGADEDQ